MVDRLSPPMNHPARVILEDLAAAMRAISAGMRGGAVLDFGAGSSPYRPLFAGFDRYVTADLPGGGSDLVIENGRVPADDATFDLVLSTQVLEHVREPDAYLAEARRLLTRQGRLLLSTHGIYRYHPRPEDLWRWTRPGLRRQIEQGGFEITEVIPVVSAPAAALTMLFQHVGGTLPARLRETWYFGSQWVVRFLARARTDSNDAALFVVLAEPRDV